MAVEGSRMFDGEVAAQPAISDQQLLARVRAGEERALLTLYDRYHRLLLSLALRVVGERETAEEVLQDAFLKVWRGSATYDMGRGSVSAWLFGIVRNQAIDEMRSRRQKGRLRERDELRDDLVAGDAEDFAEQTALRMTVRKAVAELPAHQRRPEELVYFGGLTHVEAAAALGEPLGTTKGRIRAAMEHLRRTLPIGADR